MSNSNLTSPTNKLRKIKKMRSTLLWQTVSRVVHGLGRVGFLSSPEGLESTQSLGSPRSEPGADRYEESVQVDLLGQQLVFGRSLAGQTCWVLTRSWVSGFAAWVFFFFFLVLTVDYGLLLMVVVVVVSGVCSATVVVIVVVEQK